MTWNRVKLLYHFNEYLRIINQSTQTLPKYWIRAMQALPELLISRNESSTIDKKPKSVGESTPIDESNQKTTQMTNLDNQDVAYRLPLIGDWKTSHFQNDSTNKPYNLTPKWQHSTSVLSSVSWNDFQIQTQIGSIYPL